MAGHVTQLGNNQYRSFCMPLLRQDNRRMFSCCHHSTVAATPPFAIHRLSVGNVHHGTTIGLYHGLDH